MLKNILKQFGREKEDLNRGQRVRLGTFGKHPGWDDHIEDIGIDTACLIAVKRILYFQGIEGNIQAGNWEQLTETQRLEEYSHLFVWSDPDDVVVGRMWSSSDGKGRTKYPMVVCAQCSNVPLKCIIEKVLPCLAKIEKQCIATTSSSDVRNIIENSQKELTQRLAGPRSSQTGSSVAFGSLAKLADRPEMGQDYTGLHRILYYIEREMTAYHNDNSERAGAGRTSHPRPVQLRVPACADSTTDSFLLWTDVLLKRLDPAATTLFLIPLNETWMDIIVGEPTTSELYCLKASLEAIPLTSSIPYELDKKFINWAQKTINDSRNGKPQQTPAPTETVTLPKQPIKVDTATRKKSSLKKIIVLSLILLLLAGVIVVELIGWEFLKLAIPE